MFKELLKAKRLYYGKNNIYPTAIKISNKTWNDLKMEGKAIALTSATGLTSHSVNGLEIYIDDTVKDFKFGFHYSDGFSEEVF